jgi:type II secretory pathway pseudopilin PulG
MRYLAVAAIVVLAATAAGAQAPTASCKAQADQKKLAGAALKSFMTKCEKDASTACTKSAAEKKLSGAAKTSHVKKCVSDAVGS